LFQYLKVFAYLKMKRLEYKVIELSTVTDKDLEEAINSAVKDGWALEGIHFAMREASKRPAMAFILFTKEVLEEQAN